MSRGMRHETGCVCFCAFNAVCQGDKESRALNMCSFCKRASFTACLSPCEGTSAPGNMAADQGEWQVCEMEHDGCLGALPVWRRICFFFLLCVNKNTSYVLWRQMLILMSAVLESSTRVFSSMGAMGLKHLLNWREHQKKWQASVNVQLRRSKDEKQAAKRDAVKNVKNQESVNQNKNNVDKKWLFLSAFRFTPDGCWHYVTVRWIQSEDSSGHTK